MRPHHGLASQAGVRGAKAHDPEVATDHRRPGFKRARGLPEKEQEGKSRPPGLGFLRMGNRW
eukprot:9269521-Alexandrium_andersonii.AAC.1